MFHCKTSHYVAMCLVSFFSFVLEPPPSRLSWLGLVGNYQEMEVTRHTPHLVWHVVCAPWVVPGRLGMTIGRAMDPVIIDPGGYSTAQSETLSEGLKSYCRWPRLNHPNNRVWVNLGMPFVCAIVVYMFVVSWMLCFMVPEFVLLLFI